MKTGCPREVVTPHRKIPLNVPDGMTAVEFFNSAANLRNLSEDNGLLRTPEDFLMYRKAVADTTEFDTSVILDTSQRILDPLGRPVRRTSSTTAPRTSPRGSRRSLRRASTWSSRSHRPTTSGSQCIRAYFETSMP